MSNPASDARNTTSSAGKFIRRQAAASAELNSATTFKEIAAILARHLLDDGQFIAVSVLEFDNNGDISGIHTTTSANRKHAFESDLYVTVTMETGGPLLQSMITENRPVLFEDVATYVSDYPALESWYEEHGIRSTLLIPLVDERVYGYISLNSVRELIKPDETQLAVFRTLVNQVSALLRANQLLEIHQETNALYRLSQELTAAQDSMDILRTLREYVAPEAQSLVMTNIGWHTATRTPNRIEMEAMIDESGEVWLERDMFDKIAPDTLAQLQTQWEAHAGQVAFIEDYDTVIADRADLSDAYERGVRSSAIIYISDGNRVTQQITVAYGEKRTFAPRIRRLYNAILQQLEVVAENQRLVRDTQITAARLGNQIGVMRTLNELAISIPSMENEHELAVTVCRAIVSALQVDHAGVALLDDKGTLARLIGEYPDIVGIGAEITQDNPLQEELRQEKHPVIVSDTSNDPRINDEMHDYFQRIGLRELVLLPLVDSRGTYLGSIGLDIFDEELTFTNTTEMLDIAESIASQTAVALQNILLLRNTQRQAQQLQQVANFGQSAQSTFDTGELISMMLTYANGVLTGDRYSVLLHDKVIDDLREVAYTAEDKIPVVDLFSGEVATRKKTTAGYVWHTQQPLYIEDFQLREDDMRFTTSHTARSAISIPIFIRGAVQGMVEIASDRQNAYTLADGAILQQLVNQLAVALENAEAYTQNKRIATSKAQVNEITNQLQRQTEIDRLMEVTVTELGKVFGAKRARIRLGKPENKS